MGLRKINTIGIKQVSKVMHLSTIAYNLKKYLKFIIYLLIQLLIYFYFP